MAWKATASFEIGVSHLERGLPCQDYCDFKLFKDVLVGVLADGAGSCQASDLGARLAVKSSLRFIEAIEMQAAMPKYQAYRSGEKVLPLKLARFLFRKVAEEVLSTLQLEAQQTGYHLGDLACTLLIFIATPSWIAAMQIGDGLLVVQTHQCDYQLLFLPDKGEFVNQTTFVTSQNALHSMQVQVLDGPIQFVSAMTDGLETVAIRYNDWSPFPPFFDPLQHFMREQPKVDLTMEAYLQAFLSSDRLNQKTSDDKSLILGLYEPDYMC